MPVFPRSIGRSPRPTVAVLAEFFRRRGSFYRSRARSRLIRFYYFLYVHVKRER